MRCNICGYIFDENKKPETCKGCRGSSCKMVKCPNCGFELLPESKSEFKLLNFIKRKIKNENK